jgi:hypothetical protein
MIDTINTVNALDSVIPTGQSKMLVQFNATSGAYINTIGVVPLEWLDTEHYSYVEVEIDVKTQKIEGVKDSFKIVDIATSKTKIYETMVNNQCKEKIYARFHLEVQLDLIRDVVTKLADKAGLLHDELADMNDYIDGVKRANKILKQSYINNPDFDFITIEQQAAEHEAKLDGGLHEAMGPKNLLGLGLYNQ